MERAKETAVALPVLSACHLLEILNPVVEDLVVLNYAEGGAEQQRGLT